VVLSQYAVFFPTGNFKSTTFYHQGTAMHVAHHPLSVEFSALKNQINLLKISNSHFSRLFDTYGDVNKVIAHAENGLDHLANAALDNRKKGRVLLKDQLFALLNAIA
jgi:uncharacterized protein YdcH (DUF465 family)